MPELPEVELTRENLSIWTHEAHRGSLDIIDERVLVTGDASTLIAAFSGGGWQEPIRTGKFLLWPFSDGYALIVHLAMTGKWVRREKAERGKTTRAVITLDTGVILQFEDQRRFGKFWWGKRRSVENISGWNKLGPDVRNKQHSALRALTASASTSKRKIVSLLLDQSIVSGIGNIVANEALYLSGIHPLSHANTLSESQITLLFEGVIKTVETSLLRDRGSEILYQGEKGAENPFIIYGRENFSCGACTATIQRQKHAGRSIFVCPRCQSPPSS